MNKARKRQERFRWVYVPFRRLISILLVASLSWYPVLPTVANAKGGSNPGAIWTTDAGGTVDKNIYENKEDVYLNGGPGVDDGPGLPDGQYYWKVTEPNGTYLGGGGSVTFTVVNGEFASAFNLWDYNPPTSHYADSSNGEYKVWVSMNPDFPPNESKTDNFRVEEPEPVYDVSITKTDSADPIQVGEETTYTIVVTNTGDTALTGVTVQDTLPSGLIYQSASPAPTSVGPPLSWTIGALDPQESVSITVVVTGSEAGTHTNQATVDAEELEEPKSASEDTTVNQPEEPVYDVSITKTDSADPIQVGEETTYTIVVTNTGDTALTGVTVQDTLPSGLIYQSASPAPTSVGPPLSWTIGALDPQESVSITVVVTGSEAGTHTNQATVDAEELEEPKSASEDTTVNEPQPVYDVSITKTDSADPIQVGQETTYTIVVTNSGDTTLTGVSVNDQLPAGMSFVSADPAPAYTSPSLGWNVGDLGPGASVEIKVVVTGTESGTWTNSAHVHSDQLEPVYTEEDTTVTEVPPVNDVSITKTDSADPINVGEETTYTISVTNTGDTTLTPVLVEDTLPTGLTYQSANPAPTSVGPPLQWDLGSLGPQETKVVTVVVIASEVGTHTNVATVEAPEQLEGSEEATEDTTVLPVGVLPSVFDISITKSDDVDPANVGQLVTYTVVITNTGNEVLTGLSLEDTLPNGLEFVSSDANVTEADGVLQWTTGDLQPEESRQFTIVTRAVDAGRWVNSVAVSAEEIPDPAQAKERTTVLPVAVLGGEEPGTGESGGQAAGAGATATTGGTLPFTGFPVYLWWFTAISAVSAGVVLEFIARRRRRLES